MRWIINVGLAVSVVGVAVGLLGCSKPPVTTTTTSSSTTTMPATMLTKAGATDILMGAGFQNPVLGPSQKYPGGWMGTATKGGLAVPVTVDSSGKIVQ